MDVLNPYVLATVTYAKNGGFGLRVCQSVPFLGASEIACGPLLTSGSGGWSNVTDAC